MRDKDKELLQELVRHEGWGALMRQCFQAEAGKVNLKDQWEQRLKGCLRDQNWAGARYYEGKIDALTELVRGNLIETLIKEM